MSQQWQGLSQEMEGAVFAGAIDSDNSLIETLFKVKFVMPLPTMFSIDSQQKLLVRPPGSLYG